ncbi:MAG: glycoside hydrolase family 127 protein, partial [Planctomycetota bacterium]
MAGKNDFYVGNRDPLLPSPLIKLPCGQIKPAGWLHRQLELEADGFTGRLTELSKFCQFDTNAWTNPNGKGENGWEEVPYWLKGFISLGHILKNERIIKEAQRWVEAVLSNQWDNGYFGWDQNYKNHDYWPNMIMLYVLRTHYEATGDERIIPFMTKYFRYQSKLPLDKLFPRDAKGRTWWQGIRAADNLDSIYWLYNRSGEKWLLDLARVNHERTQDWTRGFPSWHGVNITECFRGPAQYYQQTHDIRYLDATKLRYDTVMGIYGQVPGGMFGADENSREGYTGPR